MNARYPHCPIAPGKGCQACHDIEREISAMWRGWRVASVAVLAVFVAVLLAVMAAAA